MLKLAVFVGTRGRGSNLMAIQTAILESTGKSFEETDTERYSPTKDSAASYDAGIDAMREKIEKIEKMNAVV